MTFLFVSNPSTNHICVIFSQNKNKRIKEHQGEIEKEKSINYNFNFKRIDFI
jgi:hypothetical protein